MSLFLNYFINETKTLKGDPDFSVSYDGSAGTLPRFPVTLFLLLLNSLIGRENKPIPVLPGDIRAV